MSAVFDRLAQLFEERAPFHRFQFDLDAEVVYLEDFKSQVTLADKLAAAVQTWLVPVPVLERRLGLHRIEPDDLLTIIFTSGSTGEPKGIMLCHRNIASNVPAAAGVVPERVAPVPLRVVAAPPHWRHSVVSSTFVIAAWYSVPP